jgi:hypothetical protein
LWVRVPPGVVYPVSFPVPATSSSRRTQAVKGVDPKSTGLCPRRFESCRLRIWPPVAQRSSIGRACDCRCPAITGSLVRFRPLRVFWQQRDRTQVVTGLDLKSSGLCPRRFEPCRSRICVPDRMAEWSKAPDSSSGLFGGAGSNPAPVNFCTHKGVTRVGFEPTPPKRLRPERSALDRSATSSTVLRGRPRQ